MVKKMMMLFFLILVIIFIVGYLAVGNYFFNIALNPKNSKEFVLGEPKEVSKEEKEAQENDKKWLEKKSKDVYITSDVGNLKLHSYEIENENPSNIWAIVVHGYCGQGKDMITYAKEFYNRGYNVLIMDLRGHGQSEGDYIGMGWHDRLDVIKWANYLIEKDSSCKIMLFGVSMGAATVMMATGEELPQNIKLAIEDCGYSSIWEEFEGELKVLFNLPTFPVLNAASTVCKIRTGYKLEDGSSIEQVKKSKTPTLFIHGAEDKFVPFSMLDKIYEAASCEKQKLVVEGAAHAKSATVNPELYWNTIDEFIARYL